MHALSGREFQIGLTMSGAISAGAYTAGVLDFLIEALDAWEDARNGPDADTVPNHRVGIKVMSGASAGAITAAISAIALVQAEDAAGERKVPGAYFKDNFTYSWLQVSGTTEMPQIDQGVRHQLHTVMALLFELKAQQQPFEFILPRERVVSQISQVAEIGLCTRDCFMPLANRTLAPDTNSPSSATGPSGSCASVRCL
jgi:hypothetical protein